MPHEISWKQWVLQVFIFYNKVNSETRFFLARGKQYNKQAWRINKGKVYSQLSISIVHICRSMGKYWRSMGQDAVIVNLEWSREKHAKNSLDVTLSSLDFMIRDLQFGHEALYTRRQPLSNTFDWQRSVHFWQWLNNNLNKIKPARVENLLKNTCLKRILEKERKLFLWSLENPWKDPSKDPQNNPCEDPQNNHCDDPRNNHCEDPLNGHCEDPWNDCCDDPQYNPSEDPQKNHCKDPWHDPWRSLEWSLRGSFKWSLRGSFKWSLRGSLKRSLRGSSKWSLNSWHDPCEDPHKDPHCICLILSR